MKRSYLLPLLFLLLLPVTIVHANSPPTEEFILTEEELLKEAERHGWLEPSRVPETTENLKEKKLVHQLSQQFLKSIQARESEFSISGFTLDFAITSKEHASKLIFQAVIEAYNQDEYLAYDARGYSLRYSFTSSTIQARFEHKYGMTQEQADYVEKETKRLAPIITKNSKNDHDKVKAIHDFVVLNTEYDDKMRQEYNTPYHALTLQETLCSGYSTLTYKLLEAADVPVRLISGTSRGIGHAWNMVKLDGKWYHLDTTWDDPKGSSKNSVNYNYYMLDDKTLADTHTWESGGLNRYDRPYPEAVSNYKLHLENIHYFDLLKRISQSSITLNNIDNAVPYFQEQIDYYEEDGVVFLPKDISLNVLRRISSIIATNNRDVEVRMYFQPPSVRNSEYQRLRLTFNYKSGRPTVKKLQFVQPKSNLLYVHDSYPVKIEATFSNGKVLDVTSRSDFLLIDPDNITNRSNGVIQLIQRGTFDMFARFREQEVTIPIQSEFEWLLNQDKFQEYEEKKSNVPRNHTWTVVFNDELHRSVKTNPQQHVVVTKRNGENVDVNIVTDDNIIKIHPPFNGYEAKTTYNVYLYNIQNNSKDIISPAVRFTFTTK